MQNTVKHAKRWNSTVKLLLRMGVILFVQTIAVIIFSLFSDSVVIEDFKVALLAVIVISLLNAILWPLLMRITLPVITYTFGIASLFLNGFIIFFASELVEGFSVSSIWGAIGVAFGLTLINVILSWLFAIDDESMFYKRVVKRFSKRNRADKVSEITGVIFLEIDGLSEPTLQKAIELGFAKNIKKLKKTNSHTISEWETDLSCQTGASQAGILHGSNDNMPAFRWVEKKNDNRIIASSGPVDTPIIEERHTNHDGLLSHRGGSRGNLLSGDAHDVIFTFSKIGELKKLHNPIFYAYYSNPYSFIRTILFVGWDIILEYRSRIRQHKNNVQPRLGREKRGGIYPLVRAFTTVILRDIIVYTIIGDVYEGRKDAIYATFMGYDEVAHHSGVEDIDAYKALQQIDKQIGRINDAIADSPRNYHLVVLSDHGQSNGATFKQRYGYTLEDHVKTSIGKDLDILGISDSTEGTSFINLFLTGITTDTSRIVGKISNKLLANKIDEKGFVSIEQKKLEGNGKVVITPKVARKTEKENKNKADDMPQLIVLASGNLGLIYFTDWKHRLTYEEIEKNYPTLITDLANHEGIGFVLVNSKKDGGIVFGAKGKYYLETDKIEGENPLADFRKRAPQHLRRSNEFEFAPDIYVNSFYDKENDEIAAFEELIGAHGGMGGNQSRPFIFYPSELEYPNEKVVGAENLHKVIKSWVPKA